MSTPIHSARSYTRMARRHFLTWTAAATAGCMTGIYPAFAQSLGASRDLRIKEWKVTPIALPDPPILAASGCHGPYFLRTIVELVTDDGVRGIGETYGSSHVVAQLQQAREQLVGKSAFAYHALAALLPDDGQAAFAAIEMACLDALGRATGRRACELLGGPVRDDVEFAAYLFYRFAADDPRVLSDERLVDDRGQGAHALDDWGEVRTAEAMTQMAARFREKWGFRVLKLKAGVLVPETELETLQRMHEAFGDDVPLRIDPNGRWKLPTAIRCGRRIQELGIPLEYYEDPVSGQQDMAQVRRETHLRMATNSCVSRWNHVDSAARIQPIDVVLGDIYWFGGISGLQRLGAAAQSLGWGLGMHSNNHAGVTMAAMIHAAAATPEMSHAADTHYVWLADGYDIIAGGKLPIRNGCMQVPAGPGLGVELDQDRLAQAHETFRKCGMRDRDDGSTMHRFQPGWQRTLF